MRYFFFKYKSEITMLLFALFFVSLVFTSNAINSKIIISILLFSLFFYHKDKLQWKSKNHYPLLLLFLIASFSLLYSEDLARGLKEVEGLSILPVTIIIFGLLSIEENIRQRLFLFFVTTILLATLYSHIITIINFISNGESSFRNIFNLNYSYMSLGNTINLHPTYYSLYILTAIIISINYIREGINKSRQLILTLTIIYFAFFILHLSSRISLVTLYLIIIYNIALFIKQKKKYIKGLIYLICFHALAIFAILNIGTTKYRLQEIFGLTYYNGYSVNDGSHKLRLWEAAINANKNFIFGNGIGDNKKSLTIEYKSSGLEKPFEESYNSHNQYIEYYVGIGLFGVLTFCFILYYYLNNFKKQNNQIGIQFIIIVAILCITECLWNRHQGIVFISIMLGLLWKSKELDSNSFRPQAENS